VQIEVFTRWRPDEIAANISDTEVLPLIAVRGGSVHLCDRLHAKYVRFDDCALVGSANLTSSALGWSASSNIELLIAVPADLPELRRVENILREESVKATAAIAKEVERVAALLPLRNIEEPNDPELEIRSNIWHPHLREPRDLFIAYSQGPRRLSRASAQAAAIDLIALDVPSGLDRATFDALVGTRLLQAPVIQRLDTVLGEPQRFGAVRDEIAKYLGIERGKALHIWQTLMRWLLHFLRQRYTRTVPLHSEIVIRAGSIGGEE